MVETRIICNNERIISHLRTICTNAALRVAKDTSGIIDADSKNATVLDSNIKLINNIISHELTRRYGE